MNTQQLNEVIKRVHDVCVRSGVRFTEKRQRILELLLLSPIPLSAYEIADIYNKKSQASMPVMSVYRMLEFLESEHFVHKLTSANKYVACTQIACKHTHEISHFLICGHCQSVKEIAIPKSVIDQVGAHVQDAGYKMAKAQLELQCLCDACAQSNV